MTDFVVGGYGYAYPPDTLTKDQLHALRAQPAPPPKPRPPAAVPDTPTPTRTCSLCHGTGRLQRPTGILNGRSVLTEPQVAAIRRRRTNGQTLRSLAALFGVSVKTIENIVYRRTWRHVP